MESLKKCNICPRHCNINRYKQLGFCNIDHNIYLARCDLYNYEEPSISGTLGSGAIFFSGCNLRCIYCQNYEISNNKIGKKVSINRLKEILLELQNKKAHNINLVTPTMYIPMIKKAIIAAKKEGLRIPIVYNTSGYEDVDALKELEGLIDVYMPDFKYIDDKVSLKYSKCPNYVDIVKKAIKEMYRQTGKNIFNKDGIMIKGILVRHLILPNLLDDSKKILKYLHDTYRDNIYISIMNQYTPLTQVKNIKELNKKITEDEYYKIIDYALKIGINNAYVQDNETVSESFIPKFDYTGVDK